MLPKSKYIYLKTRVKLFRIPYLSVRMVGAKF